MLLSKNDPSYLLISRHYDGKFARRSGVPYMQHIDEGLIVLDVMGASLDAQRAYCLHPYVQSDEDLNRHIQTVLDYDLPWVYALEYRSVANEYLSHRMIGNISQIRLSPLYVVNQMLIADKVQNRKDFELYHKDTHPRSSI